MQIRMVNLHDDRASAVVLNGIFRLIIALKLADVVLTPSSLESPLGGPTVPEGLEHSCLYSWCNEFRELNEMPVDDASVNARGSCKAKWFAPPSRRFHSDPLDRIKYFGFLDGSEADALDLALHLVQHVVIPQVMFTCTDA